MKAAIYARYSSDQQRDESVEDQIAICQAMIAREGWTFAGSYTDRAMQARAISGQATSSYCWTRGRANSISSLPRPSIASAETRSMLQPSSSRCSSTECGSSRSRRARSANCTSA